MINITNQFNTKKQITPLRFNSLRGVILPIDKKPLIVD